MVQIKLVMRFVCLLFTLLAAPVAGQEKITPDEFLDVADGHTLSFTELSSGGLVGIEEYLTRKLTVWKDQSGLCVYGKVTIEGGQLCFLYDNDADGLPVCWWTFRDGETLMVLLADLGRHEIQTVTEISNERLDCPNVPAV